MNSYCFCPNLIPFHPLAKSSNDLGFQEWKEERQERKEERQGEGKNGKKKGKEKARMERRRARRRARMASLLRLEHDEKCRRRP